MAVFMVLHVGDKLSSFDKHIVFKTNYHFSYLRYRSFAILNSSETKAGAEIKLIGEKNEDYLLRECVKLVISDESRNKKYSLNGKTTEVKSTILSDCKEIHHHDFLENEIDFSIKTQDDVEFDLSPSIFNPPEPSETVNTVIDETIGETHEDLTNAKKHARKKKLKPDPSRFLKESMKIEARLISLRCGLYVYVRTGKLLTAQSILSHYRSKISLPVDLYNIVLEGWVIKGDFKKMNEILNWYKKDNVQYDMQTYLLLLTSLSKLDKEWKLNLIKPLLSSMEKNGIRPESIFTHVNVKEEKWDNVMKAIKKVQPDYVPDPLPNFPSGYDNLLVNKLNKPPDKRVRYDVIGKEMDNISLQNAFKKQIAIENSGKIIIKSISTQNKTINSKHDKMNALLKSCEDEWRIALLKAIMRLRNEKPGLRSIVQSPYPYLNILKPEVFVEIIIQIPSKHDLPYEVFSLLGKFLFNVVVNELKINTNLFKEDAPKILNPAFYYMYKYDGKIMEKLLMPHHVLSKLFKETEQCCDLNFDCSSLPMLVPPSPWISQTTGGYLLTSVPFLRTPEKILKRWKISNETDNQQLYPCFDSLNQLGGIPWIINKPILELIIDIYNNNGSEELGIPQSPSLCPPIPKFTSDMLDGSNKSGYKKVWKDRMRLKNQKDEMYSLWRDALYKLSIANHYKDDVFWFPYNFDFRGRSYPCPPHFNHLGRAKLSERLAYANEIMPDIMDSADNPMKGKKWWMQFEDPWQVLACAKEVTKAVRSPDHTKYVCHFPVHQDEIRKVAEKVNVHPSEYPQDVYTGVAELVEKERAKDAAMGHKIAQALEGNIQRKVKQTVMTIVYGVTLYGAKLQILKQLSDVSGLMEEDIKTASNYLAMKNWLNDNADVIVRTGKKPVQWITPLGLPIIQPYHKTKSMFPLAVNNFDSMLFQVLDVGAVPDKRKQKNGFPPNFIHSLDATHMMLTSLYCARLICREQFYALYKQDILKDLSDNFLKEYGHISSNHQNSNERDLMVVVSDVPKLGKFDIKSVLKSTYFFS
ncbi:DNA-directed RNA polymerase, mitochondrial [Nymphon striatum]|nr:DNA-directed RNA polymerase, mitochondrial [Nymphon striatum]